LADKSAWRNAGSTGKTFAVAGRRHSADFSKAERDICQNARAEAWEIAFLFTDVTRIFTRSDGEKSVGNLGLLGPCEPQALERGWTLCRFAELKSLA
jgi:hypothetical protein